MLLCVYSVLAVLPLTICHQLGNPQISDGTKIYNLEDLVYQLIDSKLGNIDLVFKQNLSELERKFEAKAEMIMSAVNEQGNIVKRIEQETRR
mgnify:CR=1 FL=1